MKVKRQEKGHPTILILLLLAILTRTPSLKRYKCFTIITWEECFSFSILIGKYWKRQPLAWLPPRKLSTKPFQNLTWRSIFSIH